MGLRWPAGLDAAAFLASHWQQRPRLLRRAFQPEAWRLPDANTIAGLSLDAQAESRLVQHRKYRAWQLERGPFTAARLSGLPQRDWTLLIQDTDSLLPQVARLFDLVDFVPAWRRDDVMISIAAPGGTVGPHVDQYDVFLAQLHGTREWRIGARRHDPALVKNAPLPVLRHFKAMRSWTLAPGDILYLPPGIPHFGVAGDDATPCLTASLGFRAPDAGELAAVMLDEQLSGTTVSRYGDAGLAPAAAQHGELDEEVLRRLQHMLAGLPEARFALGRAMGRLVTEIKPWLAPRGRRSAPTGPALERALASGRSLILSPSCRAAWVRRGVAADLFVNGECFELPRGSYQLARALAGQRRRVAAATLPSGIARSNALLLLAELYRRGWLDWGES